MSADDSIRMNSGSWKQTIESDHIGKLPSCTNHAKLRWLQRSGSCNTRLSEAWRDGFYVGDVSRGGTARLHSPTKTILVETHGNIVTVLDAEYTSYTDDHLVACDKCDLKYKPTKADRSCRWCGYNVQAENESNQSDDPE